MTIPDPPSEDLTQEDLDGWRGMLSDFEIMWEKVFEPARISRDAAFLAWIISFASNRLTANLDELADRLEELE